MKFWHSAFDQAKRREFGDILRALPVGLIAPFAYSTASDTDAFLQATFEESAPLANIVLSLPGKQQFYVDNACIASAKFAHVIDCMRMDYQRGALTWSVLEAHHAALFGMRALAALFGLTIHRALGRTILVDFWPEFGPPDHARRFARKYRTVTDPIRVMMPSDELLLEQQHFWVLLRRLLTIIRTTSTSEAEMLTAAEAVASPSVSHIRNEVLYYTARWPDFGDIQLARFYRTQKIDWLSDSVRSDPDLLALTDALFWSTRTYADQLLLQTGNQKDDVHYLLKLNVNRRIYAA